MWGALYSIFKLFNPTNKIVLIFLEKITKKFKMSVNSSKRVKIIWTFYQAYKMAK